MKWKQGDERFTNLYVGSEIGPFAANIRSDARPKGVLKRWPLYLVLYRNDKTRHIDRSKNLARWILSGCCSHDRAIE